MRLSVYVQIAHKRSEYEKRSVLTLYVRQTFRFNILLIPLLSRIKKINYSHSMVAGGLELISYTTRFTPRTLLMISLETFARNS